MTGTLTPERIERVAKYLYIQFRENGQLSPYGWDKQTEITKTYWRDQAISVLCEAMKNGD